MARKKAHGPEESVTKLRQVEALTGQGRTGAEAHTGRAAAAGRDGVAEEYDAALAQRLSGSVAGLRNAGLGRNCDDQDD